MYFLQKQTGAAYIHTHVLTLDLFKISILYFFVEMSKPKLVPYEWLSISVEWKATWKHGVGLICGKSLTTATANAKLCSWISKFIIWKVLPFIFLAPLVLNINFNWAVDVMEKVSISNPLHVVHAREFYFFAGKINLVFMDWMYRLKIFHAH
jgi:hypothetical protein